MLYRKSKKLKITDEISLDKIPKLFEYRLPTEEEFIQVASSCYSDKTQKKIDKTGASITINAVNASRNDEIKDVTAPVESYWPNKVGIYNILGNVAEMIAEKGIAKGGSWKHNVGDISVDKRFEYHKPENWLGFRCVCVKLD